MLDGEKIKGGIICPPPHCVLKLGFTQKFPGNQDATLDWAHFYKILLVFEVCNLSLRVKGMHGKS